MNAWVLEPAPDWYVNTASGVVIFAEDMPPELNPQEQS